MNYCVTGSVLLFFCPKLSFSKKNLLFGYSCPAFSPIAHPYSIHAHTPKDAIPTPLIKTI